jgi:1-acyl-sn-glycerol-3-phosphate acyltransferase
VPDERPCIYIANHTSHLDFVAIWGSLPRAVRAHTRPVAGADYWDRGPLRRIVARYLLGAILVERAAPGADRITTMRTAERGIGCAARALVDGTSLIVFPEGTRGSGGPVAPFKSGLYHLCRQCPDVEVIPVFLSNMDRILPKGETVPLPLPGSITFGAPLRLRQGEDKTAFLARARAALMQVNRTCRSLSTAISQAS